MTTPGRGLMIWPCQPLRRGRCKRWISLVSGHDRSDNGAKPQIESEPNDMVPSVITGEDGVSDELGRAESIRCRDAARAQIDIQILELDRQDAGDRRLDAAAGGPTRFVRRIPDNRLEARTRNQGLHQRGIVLDFTMGITSRGVEQPSVPGKPEAATHRSEPRKLPFVEIAARRIGIITGDGFGPPTVWTMVNACVFRSLVAWMSASTPITHDGANCQLSPA